MNASLIPHFFCTHSHGLFEIQSFVIYGESMCTCQYIVFWNNKHISFKNVLINEATIIDDEIIEVEILHRSGDITYHYYQPNISQDIRIKEEHSLIVQKRKQQNIEILKSHQKELYELEEKD